MRTDTGDKNVADKCDENRPILPINGALLGEGAKYLSEALGNTLKRVQPYVNIIKRIRTYGERS